MIRWEDDEKPGPTNWPDLAILLLALAVLGALIVLLAACKPTPAGHTTTPAPAPGGVVCSDGTRSTATGRGACSHHGGVA